MSVNIIEMAIILIKITLVLLGIMIPFFCFASIRNRRRGKNALVILQNARTKQEYPIFYWENSIGRNKNCDIVIDDASISREHAVIFRRKDGWFVSDTHSKLGVLVTGQKIKKKTKININDKISQPLRQLRACGFP